MILSKNPVQGGSVVIRASFRDEAGQSYVPVEGSCYYALYAQGVDGYVNVFKQWTPLPAASVVDIVLQGGDLELFPNCGLKRRVVLGWKYLRAGEEVIGRDMVDFEVTPLPVSDPPLGPPPPLPEPEPPAPEPDPEPEPPLPSPPSYQGPYEDTIDGLRGYDAGLDMSVRVARGFVEMSAGSVLASSVSEGLLVFVYSFFGPGEVLLIGVHGDTHEVSQPIFRATAFLHEGRWLLVQVDENDMGLEAGTEFNFRPVS
jgi:hypothetical protein